MADIRLITKNTDLSHPPKPYDWDVLINGRPYFVVRMEGYVHSIGGRWGDNDLWAYPREEAPSFENLIEFSADQPVAWGIRYEPQNYTKTKWDETEVRSGGGIAITRNGEVFCHITGGLNYGIDEARTMIARFSEHPLELNAIDFDQKAVGRRVWWRSEPAIIESFIKGQADVILKPDGIPRFTTPPEFAKEEPDYYEDETVKTSILDNHIWWFRD